MSKLKIITNPHPTLRKKANKVKINEISKLNKLLDDMEVTMRKKDGIGLAANQVNILKRIIVINTKDGALALINPEIKSKSFKKETAEEGCLSVPGIYGVVKRPQNVKVAAYTRDKNKIELKAKGLLARVIQHEVDHLDGVLFIDKVKEQYKYDINGNKKEL